MPAHALRGELERLAELLSYGVLDTAPEAGFDDVVAAASEVSGCPIALISLLDADRQWFKARRGLEVDHTSRELAFCEHALRQGDTLVVPDARHDRRFRDNALVTGPPGVRFYAGFPLRTPTGAILGTLCVLDTTARPEGLTSGQCQVLTVLADQVMTQLELRRALAERERTQASLLASQERYRVLFDASPVGQVELSPAGAVRRVNAAFAELFGAADPAVLDAELAAWALAPDDSSAQDQELGHEPGRVRRLQRTVQLLDGSHLDIAGTVVAVAQSGDAPALLLASAVDVTERNADARRLAELAELLEGAHDEAVRRNVLADTVLDTVDVGIVACDADGHLTLFNRATRAFHGMPADPQVGPADWADRYALYAEDGATQLTRAQVPLVRALQEGRIQDVLMLIAPQGLPARTVRCDGRALTGPQGEPLGAVVVMTDVTAERAAARELAEAAEYTAVLLETAQSGIWSCDAHGGLTFVNRLARTYMGWPLEVPLAALLADGAAMVPEGIRVMTPDGSEIDPGSVPLARAAREGVTVDQELVLSVPGQPHRTLRVHAGPLHDEHGAVTGGVATAHDITALRASQARFRAAFLDGPTPVARLDRQGLIEEVNPALRRLTGRRSGDLLQRPLLEHVHRDDRERLRRVLAGPGTGAEPVELRVLRVDGSTVWCELATTVSADLEGRTGVLAQFLDVQARKTQELVLEQAAQRDALTGLDNRSRLAGLLETLLVATPGATAGLLFLDLDGFKAVNDRFGHEAGDAVLVEVARRVVACTRADDVVVRLGGDEFVVVCPLPEDATVEQLQVMADRVEQAVGACLDVRGHRIVLGGSVGTAVGARGIGGQQLLEQADLSMYRRKQVRAVRPT